MSMGGGGGFPVPTTSTAPSALAALVAAFNNDPVGGTDPNFAVSITTSGTAGTVTNWSSLALGGTAGESFAVIALFAARAGTPTGYLNSASGVGANSWSVQTAGGTGTGSSTVAAVIAAVVPGGTTVYFNGKSTNATDTGWVTLVALRIL